jgi:hypothetical protein
MRSKKRPLVDQLRNSLVLGLAVRLPNRNNIINDWGIQWSGLVNSTNAPVQAIEVTPDKKIVSALCSWTPPADLGPATMVQILDR